MTKDGKLVQPPARLRRLVSWQTNKVSALGARLTARRMPLGSRADFAVLAALQECGALSQADLGRRLGLDRNDVNAIMTRLQDGCHVNRGPDPDDRRRNIVTITGAGLRHLEELQKHADSVQDELLHALSSTERDHLQMLLTKLLASHPSPPA